MAMYISSNSACFHALSSQRKVNQRIRAVASSEEYATTSTVNEDKVKLGTSDLKVTKLGIGAWSWGDTSYWNNFEWDGLSLSLSFPSNTLLCYILLFLIWQ